MMERLGRRLAGIKVLNPDGEAGLEERVDAIEARIDAMQGVVSRVDGLDKRIETLEHEDDQGGPASAPG
jgi:hypothetical protein